MFVPEEAEGDSDDSDDEDGFYATYGSQGVFVSPKIIKRIIEVQFVGMKISSGSASDMLTGWSGKKKHHTLAHFLSFFLFSISVFNF